MAKESNRTVRTKTVVKIGDFNTNMSRDEDITLPKKRNKYIKRIESIVRTSLEYSDYISFLKEFMDMSKCAFFPNMENRRGHKIKIEIHHEPLTLYDIVNVVLEKFLQEGLPLNDLLIAEEVAKLHYSDLVGLVPLSKTMHQVIHSSNKLFIPLGLVFGDYKGFVEEYRDYIENSDELETIVNKLEKKLDESRKLTPEQIDMLIPKFVYLEITGVEELEKIPDKVDFSEV